MKFRPILIGLLALFARSALVLTAFAQEDTGSAAHHVSFDGFGFHYDETVAANVNIAVYTANDLTDTFPTMAPHTQFLLYSGDTVPAFPAEAPGVIRVFSTADFDEGQSGVLAQLQTLLDERPDLTAYMVPDAPMPFLPIFPAGQVIRARAQYVETDFIAGVSYITAYQQAMEPFTSSSFVYTFQGVSTDGAYYVSAIFRLNTALFSDELPSDFDYATFSEQINDYLADTITTLNEVGMDDVSPPLDALDAVVASFSFDAE